MEPYTYERRGDGYAFRVFRADGGGWVVGLFFPALILALVTFGVTLLIWAGWAIWRRTKTKGKLVYSPTKFVEFTVTPEKILTASGEIPISRLNSLEIRNRFDRRFEVAVNRSSGGFVVGGAAGAGMAVASGFSDIGQSLKAASETQLAKSAYFLVAEFGGREVKLAEKMTEAGARGLQADIIRVIQGQAL